MSGFLLDREDMTAPVLTYYDDATGERTELSVATLDNWVAKTANLLVDGAGLGPGHLAAVLLPPHWQNAAVLLGCWTAGVAVGAQPADADVVFAAADRLSSVTGPGEVYGFALAPLAAPMRPEPPPGVSDYVVAVRAYGDHFTPSAAIGLQAAAVIGPPALTRAELLDQAAARAGELGLAAGARLLVDAAVTTDPVDWLLAPLAVGGSIVLCGHLDPSTVGGRIETERVTVSLAG